MGLLRFLRRREARVQSPARAALTASSVKHLKRGLTAGGQGFVDSLLQLDECASSHEFTVSEDVRRSSVSLSHMLRESNDNAQVEECISVILFMNGCSILVRLLRRIHTELQQTPLATPEQDMLTCAVANDCLVLVRELSFLSAVASRELRNVSTIALVYGFMEFPECFEPACMSCEELLAARGSFSIVRLLDIPRAIPILMAMSPRRLAIACRVLSLLVFEPERREPEKPLSAAHMQGGWLQEKRHYAAARGMQDMVVNSISSEDLSRAVPMLTRNTVCENQLVLAHAAPLFRRVAALMAVLPPAPHPPGTQMVTPRPHTEEQDRQFRAFVSMLPQGAHVSEALEGDGRGALDMLTNITIDDIARRYGVDVMDIYAVLRNVPGMSLLEGVEAGDAASVHQPAREAHYKPAGAWLWQPLGQSSAPEAPTYGVHTVSGAGAPPVDTPDPAQPSATGSAAVRIRSAAAGTAADSPVASGHGGVRLSAVREALAACPPARRMLAEGVPPLTVAWVVKAGMHDMHQLMSGIMSMPAEQRKQCGADLVMLCLGGSKPGKVVSDVVQTQWGPQGRGRGSAHADWALHSNALAALTQWLTSGDPTASMYAPPSPPRTFVGEPPLAQDEELEQHPHGQAPPPLENSAPPNLAKPDWALLQRAAAAGVLSAFAPAQGATAESWHALRRISRVATPADPVVPPHIRIQCVLQAAARVQVPSGDGSGGLARPSAASSAAAVVSSVSPTAEVSHHTSSEPRYAGGEIFSDADCVPPPRGGGVVQVSMGEPTGGAAAAEGGSGDDEAEEAEEDTITSTLSGLVGALIPEQLRVVPRELLARMGLGQVLDAAEALSEEPPAPRSIRRRHKLNEEPSVRSEALQGTGLEDLAAWLSSDEPASSGAAAGDAAQVPVVAGYKALWRSQLEAQYRRFHGGADAPPQSRRHPVSPPWLRGVDKTVRVLAQRIDEATLSSQQTAVLCVLAGMSMSRMKRFAQAELGAAGLPRLLWQQAADIDWRYEQPPADWTPPRLHGPGCRCTPESTHRIQWLRLLHSLLEKQEARSGADRWLGAASRLLSVHEASMLHSQEVVAAGWTGAHAAAETPADAVQGGVVWAPSAVGAGAASAAIAMAKEAGGWEAKMLAALRPGAVCGGAAEAVDQVSALDASRAALQSCVLSPAGKLRAEESALAAQLELTVRRSEQVGDASGVDWRTYLLLARPAAEPAAAREALESIAVPMGTGVGSGVTAMMTLSVHPLVAAVAPRPGLLHALHSLGRWGNAAPAPALQPYFPWPRLQLQDICAPEQVLPSEGAGRAQLDFVCGALPTPSLGVADLRVLPAGKPRVMCTQVPHVPPATVSSMGHGVVQRLSAALGSSNALALFGVMDVQAAAVGAVTSHSLLTRTMQVPLPEDAGLDTVPGVQPPPMQRLFAANAAVAAGASTRPSAAQPEAWQEAYTEAATEQPGVGMLPGSSPVGHLYPDGVTRTGALTGGSCPSVGLLGRLLLALGQLPYRAPLRFWVASCVDTCLRPAPPVVRQWAARSGVLTRMLGDLMLLFDRNLKRNCTGLDKAQAAAERAAGEAAAATESVPLLTGAPAEPSAGSNGRDAAEEDTHDAGEDSMDSEGCGGVTERHLMQSAFDVLGEVTKLNMQGVALLDSMLTPAAASALLRLAFERPVDSNVAVRNCMLSLYYAGVGHAMRRAAELGHAPPADVASPARFMQMPVLHALAVPSPAPGQTWEDAASTLPVVQAAAQADCVDAGALNALPGWSLMSRLAPDADGRVRLPAELAADWFGQKLVMPEEYATMLDTPLLHGTHRSGAGAGPTGGEAVSSGFSRGLHTHVVPLVHAVMGAVRTAEEVTQETLSNVNTALLHCVVAHAQGRLPALVAALRRQDAAMARGTQDKAAVAASDRTAEAAVAAGVPAASTWLPCVRSAAQWAHSRGNVYDPPEEDSDLDDEDEEDDEGSVTSSMAEEEEGASPDSGGVYEAATAKRKAGHAAKNPSRHSTLHVPRTGVLASYVRLLAFWKQYYTTCDRDLPSLVCSTGFSHGVWREVVLLLRGEWTPEAAPGDSPVALRSLPEGVQAPHSAAAQLPDKPLSWLHPAEYGSVALGSEEYRTACVLLGQDE